MKTSRKLLFCALVVLPLLKPTAARAGGLDDLLNWLFGWGSSNKPTPPPSNQNCPPGSPGTGTSVPVNEGLICLMVAGMALGAWMIQKNNEGRILVGERIDA